MKKVLLSLSLVLPLVMSCKKEGCTDATAINYNVEAKKDDGTCKHESLNESVIEISSNITSDTTWETGKVYVLKSRISVVDGVTLTIEPGTIIKGDVGTCANATALIIAQGGKIMAEGTSTSPIIFTSTADNIQTGEILSPNLSGELNGLWGGLIVLGLSLIHI